ncbi:MAG: hypothetical protein ACK4RK_20095 [Gemmataceae bacterium]
MEDFQGQLLKEGQVFIEQVQGRMMVDLGPNGEQYWSGFFPVPEGHVVQLDDEFDMILANGRSNRVRIERVNAMGPSLVASFSTVRM